MFAFSELKGQLTPSLHELGLRDQEIDLYVHTSLLGPSTVAMLAHHLGLSAPNVYKLIARLEEVGLTKFSEQRGYHRKLIVEPPTKIIELLQMHRGHVERLTQGLRSNIGDLLASFYQGDAPPVFRVLQGEEQFRRSTQLLFEDAKDEILVMGSLDHFVEMISRETYATIAKERIERQLKFRGLLRETPLTRKLQKSPPEELREIRFLPENTLVATMQLTQRKAILWQPKAPLAIAVDDSYLVEMWRCLFEAIWKRSK